MSALPLEKENSNRKDTHGKESTLRFPRIVDPSNVHESAECEE